MGGGRQSDRRDLPIKRRSKGAGCRDKFGRALSEKAMGDLLAQRLGVLHGALSVRAQHAAAI